MTAAGTRPPAFEAALEQSTTAIERVLLDALPAVRATLLSTYPGVWGRLAVDEIVNETYRRARRGFAGFRGDADRLGAWLLAIARNVLIDTMQRERRHGAGPLPADGPARTTTPSAPLRRQELKRWITLAVEGMTADYREVLLLRYRRELPFASIAARMGRTEDAVRSLHRRALQDLESSLGSRFVSGW